jgi:hypothetical protein
MLEWLKGNKSSIQFLEKISIEQRETHV